MRRIEILFRSLNDQEHLQIASLSLRGRQKQVRDKLLRSAKEKHDADLSGLGISKAHLDEICSVLLQKSYDALAPGGALDLFSFLIYKQMTRCAFDQMRLLERRMAKSRNRSALAEFYLIAFYAAHLVPAEEQDYEYLAHIETKLTALRPHDSVFDKQTIAMFNYRFRLIRTFHIDEQTSNLYAKLKTEFEKMAEKSLHSKNEFVRYQFHRTGLVYCLLFHKDPEKYLKHWEEATRLLHVVPELLLEREELVLRSYRAEYDFMVGNIEEAYERLLALTLENERYNRIVAFGYFRLRMFDIATILGHYEQAEEVFLSIPISPLETSRSSRAAAIYIRGALMYLLWGKYQKAHKCLHEGYVITAGKSYSFYNDVRLRFIEACYYYLSGDREHALNVCSRALHFLRSRELGLRESEFGFYFKFIEAAMALHDFKKPIPLKIKKHYEKYSQGAYKFFGILLDKILQTRPGS